MAKTLYMYKGLPASGKSSAAKGLAVQAGYKRVNKDDLRDMIDGGIFSPKSEEIVCKIHNEMVAKFLEEGNHVLVDNTNLNPKHEQQLRDIAKKYKANFEIVDLTNVSVEECIKRDLARPKSVGEKVIREMADKWLTPQYPIAPEYDPKLTDIVLSDVDGTVAIMNGRGPFEWGKVGTDLPRKSVILAIQRMTNGHTYSTTGLVFASGRDGICREDTRAWLQEQCGPFDALLMKEPGDMRRDSIVKRELYEKYIKGKYNVVAIFDDRPQVIRECWYALGFKDRVFNVGDGREF